MGPRGVCVLENRYCGWHHVGLRWLSLLCGKDDGGTRLREDCGWEGQSETGLGPAPHREFRQVELEEEHCRATVCSKALYSPPPPEPVPITCPRPGYGI